MKTETSELVTKLKALRRRITRSQQAIVSNQELLLRHARDITFECVCGQIHKFSECSCIQTHWYERPHGCTDGDTWHLGDVYVVCPTTDVRNRAYFSTLGSSGPDDDVKFKRLMRDIAKEVVDEYKELYPGTLNHWFNLNMGPVLQQMYPT